MDCLYGQSIGLLLKIIDYLFHYDLRLATERAICVVGRCSESSRTASTFRFLCSVRLAAHPARYALEGGVGAETQTALRPGPVRAELVGAWFRIRLPMSPGLHSNPCPPPTPLKS